MNVTKLKLAAEEFCRKVQAGEARSVRSYQAFKEALDEADDRAARQGVGHVAEVHGSVITRTPAGYDLPTGTKLYAAQPEPIAAEPVPKPFAAPGRWFPVGLLGHPMREFQPGKWESASWPSEAALKELATPAPEVPADMQAFIAAGEAGNLQWLGPWIPAQPGDLPPESRWGYVYRHETRGMLRSYGLHRFRIKVRAAAPEAPAQPAERVALRRLRDWCQSMAPNIKYLGDHPIAVASAILDTQPKSNP